MNDFDIFHSTRLFISSAVFPQMSRTEKSKTMPQTKFCSFLKKVFLFFMIISFS